MEKTILSKNSDGYGYKYTDLSEIHRYLETINSRYIQKIERIDGDDYIFTKRCFNEKWEDEWLPGSRVVQATLSGIKNPAQEQGSALTYARRYSLLMAYGLATDDDDAQSLSEPIEVTQEEANNYILDFGKHKGKKISELPSSYIGWLLDTSKNERLIKIIEMVTGQVPLTDDDVKEWAVLHNEMMKLAQETHTDPENIRKAYKVPEDGQMSTEQLKSAIKKLKDKKGE